METAAGAEVDAASRRVTKIIFSDDGKLGSHAHTRAIDAVRMDGRTVVVEEVRPSEPTRDPVVWSRAIHLVRDGRASGHLAGVAVGEHGAIEAVFGRHHWWTPRYRLAGSGLDLSFPGEIRTHTTTARAA